MVDLKDDGCPWTVHIASIDGEKQHQVQLL